MARNPAFTEQQVIEAAQVLNEKNKNLNGTNLRLEIGAGSPMKLMETYNKLLAIGKIKVKSEDYVEELEAQLEAQLELLAKVEDENNSLRSENDLLFGYIKNLEVHVPFSIDFEEHLLKIFTQLHDEYALYPKLNLVLDSLKERLIAKNTYEELSERLSYLQEVEPHLRPEEGLEDLQQEISSIELKMDILFKQHTINAQRL